MLTDIVVPRLGAEVTDVTVLEWLKGPGESVEENEVVAVIETDKLTNEVTAPASGLLHILAGQDAVVAMGERLGVIASTPEEYARLTAAGAGSEAAPPPTPVQGEGPRRVASTVPIRGARQVIAERMLRSLQETAQVTDFSEADVEGLVQLRARLTAVGREVSYLALMVALVGRVLKEQPLFNASLVDGQIVMWADINIGVAVAVEDSLVVPVVRGVTEKSLWEISAELQDLIQRARADQLTPDDMQGGTFTITNIGSYGSRWATPILNPPEVAILATGLIAEKPVVRGGQLAIGQLMGCSLTFDHRIIDGAAAGRFMARLRELLEKPESVITE